MGHIIFVIALAQTAVINYVRSHFGKHFKSTITPAQVAALRKSLLAARLSD
jgi:hypothetical protein